MKLSGVVAILDDQRQVTGVRDLGPVPIDVKAGFVLPIVENKPALNAGEEYGSPTFIVNQNDVTRNWPVQVAKTDAQKDAELVDFLMTDGGNITRAFALLVLQEINVLRTKAGLANYTQAQFVTALKAKMR